MIDSQLADTYVSSNLPCNLYILRRDSMASFKEELSLFLEDAFGLFCKKENPFDV
jgi:hypothetical protein